MSELPSHEERRKFSEATRDLPEWAQLSVEEIEMLDEELYEKVIRHGTTADAIVAMQRRLRWLDQQQAKTLFALARAQEKTDSILVSQLKADLDHLAEVITTTRTRLEDYRNQQENQN